MRHRLELALLKAASGLLRQLSIERAASVSAWAWVMLAPVVAPRRHRRAHANLAIAFPAMPAAERRRIVRAHWDNLGRVMAETLMIERLAGDPSRFEVVNEELLAPVGQVAGPLVAVSLHLGNWELVAWPLYFRGARPGAVYRRVDNPHVEKWLHDQRVELFPGGLWGRGKGVSIGEAGRNREIAALQIARFVHRGGVLCLVADLYDRGGVVVPFFGKEAPSYRGPAQLARSARARILAGCCKRIGTQSRFRIEIVEMALLRSDDADADLLAMTTAIHAQFERWVREAPEQWMWSNRRWS